MGQIISSNQMDGTLEKEKGEIDVEYDVASPRFAVDNTEELQQGIEHLNEHGYAVFSNILSNDEIKNSVDLLWKHLESLKQPYHIRRSDPQSWSRKWPGSTHIGLLNAEGIGQSEFLWAIRGNPNIKKVFSRIWGSDELLVSFDGAGCFRDWRLDIKWKTAGGWYHCDQNPFQKPNRCSIQGLVSITDNDEFTGGLVVVPGSHKHFLELQSVYNKSRLWGDFVRIPYQYPLLEKVRPRLVKCKAGDLVVWDSRTFHCNTPALVYKERNITSNEQSELLRIVAYICMSPSSMFTPDMEECNTLEEFRQLREKFVRDRRTCTHWPLELVTAGLGIGDEKIPLKLNAFQHSLIVGTNVEPEKDTAEIIF